jgi:hypothetical protein
MSRYTGNYLKPARRVSTPGVVFSIAVETKNIHSPNTDVYSEQTFQRAVVTVTKKRRGKWSVPIVLETTDCDILRAWIHSHADTRRRNYVICPVASDVLTLTKWWDYAEHRGISFERFNDSDIRSDQESDRLGGIQVRRCLLRGKPDIFDYSDKTKRFVWLSGIQYSDIDERSIGEMIGYNEQADLFSDPSPGAGPYSVLDRALMWSQFLCHLANWWSECATAPFGLTVGSLSMGILRTYIAPKMLSTHKDEYVHKIERYACYGGRQSVWYVGTIGDCPIKPIHRIQGTGQCISTSHTGTVRNIDVRSMYPHILASELFPCRYSGRIGAISQSEIQSLAKHYGIIATCTIYSDSGEYPYRTTERVAYPRGYFSTVLTGPEIATISGKDRIVRVHDGALYTMGAPFKEAAQSLLDMRIAARAAKNGAWELFAKSVGNNLGGKLAQRRTLWKMRPDVYPERQWGEWIARNYDTGVSTRYLARCGLVYEYVKDPGGYGPYTPAFAYLTAYGRLRMREIRLHCPQQTVIAQDTDGIWLWGDAAYNELRDKCDFGNGPGQLAIKHEVNACIFLGPKHYWTSDGWVLAGFHEHHVNPSDMSVRDHYAVNPLTIGCMTAPNTLLSRLRVSKLTLDHVGGEIAPDSWVRPQWINPPADYHD